MNDTKVVDIARETDDKRMGDYTVSGWWMTSR